MRIHVNGEPHELARGATVKEPCRTFYRYNMGEVRYG